MLVINPSVCIDCGVCEKECPVGAITPDTVPGSEVWVEHNQHYANVWPSITQAGLPPKDADAWAHASNKIALFSPKPGKGCEQKT